MRKSWWLTVIVMIIPSVVACILSTPYWEVSFVAAFDYQPYLSASQTFRLMFGDSWQYLWPVVVVAILQTCGASLIMSVVVRHFRTGKLTLRSPWSMINNSIFPIAIGVIVMSVMSIVWRFLLFGLVMLVQVIAHAASLSTGAALAIIAAVAVVMFILHVITITPILFWAPIMFIYGYRFRDAAAMSFKLISGKKLYIQLLLPMLFCVGVQLLVGFLQLHVVIACAIGCVIFLFTNSYAILFTMVTFYDISELERRDVKPYENIPLPKPVKPEPQEQKEKSVESAEAPKKTETSKKNSTKSTKTKRSDAATNSEKSGKRATRSAKTSKNTRVDNNIPKAMSEEGEDGI